MSDFLKPSAVYLDNPAKTVDEVLEFLSKKAVEQGCATDETAVLEAFKAREAQGTTGMAGGFAIPHAKSSAITEPSVLVIKFAGAVEWESLDEEPIRAAIALLVPEDNKDNMHLRLLSQIAIMLVKKAFCQELLQENDPQKIAALINSGLDN